MQAPIGQHSAAEQPAPAARSQASLPAPALVTIPADLKAELQGVLELAYTDDEAEAMKRLRGALPLFCILGECGESEAVGTGLRRSLMECDKMGQLRWVIRALLRPPSSQR